MHIVCDLGTSNFRAAIVGRDEIVSEPSIIAQARGSQIAIGGKAYEMVGRSPDLVRIVFPIVEGIIRDVEAAAEMIKYSVRELSGGRIQRKFSITLSVPAGLTQVETRAIEDAARLAGAKQVQFVNSCVAGAIGAGLPVEGPHGCLVVDLGGGVTQVALLSLMGIVSSRAIRSGGQAITEGMIDRIRKNYGFQIGLRSAEELKRYAHEHTDEDHLEVRGRNMTTGLPGLVTVPRCVLDAALKSYGDTIVDLIGAVIAECPPEFAGDIIEGGIVLIGGGTHVKDLAAQLESSLEAPVLVAEDAANCVIRGLVKAEARSKGSSPFQWKRKSAGVGAGVERSLSR